MCVAAFLLCVVNINVKGGMIMYEPITVTSIQEPYAYLAIEPTLKLEKDFLVAIDGSRIPWIFLIFLVVQRSTNKGMS
ncbi:MAG: hypothetical protein CM1200mP4_5520 [Rhodospirillaceae bacterium]|nr:MAG: hypothetical protein CM1200mP4_5520 [Rhodospirillaceae bacterium]